MRRAGAKLKQTEANMLNKVWNQSSMLVQTYSSFLNMIRKLTIYSGASKSGYEIMFAKSNTEYIVQDTILSKYPVSRTWGTYTCYMWFTKLIMKSQELRPLLESLCVVRGCGKILDIFQRGSWKISDICTFG